jgi:serine/threonine protein kinase
MEVLASVQYKKLEQIGVGQGRNSTVYKAVDRLDRPVAVKEIPMAELDAQGLLDYYQEAKALFAAQHESVVPIHYACETDTHIGLVMPLFSNGSLTDRIQAGPLPLREVIRVGHGVLDGLSRIHLAEFVHFDIKPSNVLFSDKNQPMVADFGQSRLMSPEGTADAPMLYTYGFPPEALTHNVGLVESDIYQVGLTLYRAVNGDAFFESQVGRLRTRDETLEAIEHATLIDRNRYLPHVPNALRRVIRRALHPDYRERFHSATDFADALAAVRIPLDWAVTSDGITTTWKAERSGRAPLLVQLIPDTRNGRFAVEVCTDSKQGRRKKGIQEFWKDSLTLPQAERHLKQQVFANL